MSGDHPTGGDEKLWINEGERSYDSKEAEDVRRSTALDVQEVYGPKFQVFTSDRDVRIVFGNMYPVVKADGSLAMEARYRVSVIMPIQSYLDFASLTNQMARRLWEDVQAAQRARSEEAPSGSPDAR
jgi:hypothetical protein